MDYSSTGAMKSPFSPRVRQSIAGRRPMGLSSAKKNQNKYMQSSGEPTGDIVYKTPLTTVVTYGLPLPVVVTEVLTFASGDVSVRLSPCGWCWIVSGRRVLAWARSPSTAGVSSPAPASSLTARELTLPQTDLAHKADLVMLFYEDGAQMPSCIGVSPEGTVRYWPSIGQEGVYVDVSCELAGQECERLGDCTRDGLLLATTTCTLVLLNPTVVDGRATVTCRTLRPPSGWLGGIGRRVSLLFFGSMPAHADTKLVGVVVLEDKSGGDSTVALVSGVPVLQLWRGAELHEHALRRALTEAHARAQLAPHGELSSLEIMALDVRASGSHGLLLLIATANIARSPEMRYAIAHISVEELSCPRVTSLVYVRSWAGDAAEAPRFLPLARAALLYTSQYIAVVSTSVSNDKVDYINVSGEGDAILGAELCGGAPLLFSRKHGVLALSAADAAPSMCESPMGSPCPSDMYDGNLSLYEIDPNEVSMVTTDACGKLKTAFLFHLRRDAASCRALVDELFPPAPAAAPHSPPSPSSRRRPAEPEGEERDVDSVLDRTVLKIAQEMLDDIPAGDPRWRVRLGSSAACSVSLGSSAALQVAAQLQDKQRAFALYVDFLRAVGLWQRLGLLTNECGGGVTSTESALGALAERLAAARALRRLQHGPHAQLIDAAVYQVVCGENCEVEEEPEVEEALSSGALSPSDACFRRVSRIARVLRALARALPAGNTDARAVASHAAATINILTSALSEMHKCRAQWAARAQAPAAPQLGTRPPQLGPRALLPALAELHKRAITQCAHNCPDLTLRAQVYEAAAALADLILTDALQLRDSPHTRHVYEKIRREAIQPFMDEGQTERAAALAEKFKYFELLIQLCVQADDMERLYAYIDKYFNEGIAEVTFAWLADRGGRALGTLLRARGARLGGALRGWLRAAPPRAPLLALHLLHLAAPDYNEAAKVLLHMAEEETDSVNRMTVIGVIVPDDGVSGQAMRGGVRRAGLPAFGRVAQGRVSPGAGRATRGAAARHPPAPRPGRRRHQSAAAGGSHPDVYRFGERLPHGVRLQESAGPHRLHPGHGAKRRPAAKGMVRVRGSRRLGVAPCGCAAGGAAAYDVLPAHRARAHDGWGRGTVAAAVRGHSHSPAARLAAVGRSRAVSHQIRVRVRRRRTGPRLSRTGPRLSRTGPRLSRTGPRLSGTGPRLSGTGPRLCGTGPRLSGTGPRTSSHCNNGFCDTGFVISSQAELEI